MIRLTRLRSSDPLYVNPDHIERLDRAHDTVVHLLNGNEYVVVETPDEIVERITRNRANAIALAAALVAEQQALPDPVLLASGVEPLPDVVFDEGD
ncbi:MAG: flagellar FlbD family protein [Ilumatobacteraceae bacterium]